jgi:hypothetical protein
LYRKWRREPYYGFPENPDTRNGEKNGIEKRCYSLDAVIAKRPLTGGRVLSQPQRPECEQECREVTEHMGSITEERERPGKVSANRLDNKEDKGEDDGLADERSIVPVRSGTAALR